MSVVKRYVTSNVWRYEKGVMCDEIHGQHDSSIASEAYIPVVLASDYDLEHQRRVEAEALLPACLERIEWLQGSVHGEFHGEGDINNCKSCLEESGEERNRIRAHLAKWGKD